MATEEKLETMERVSPGSRRRYAETSLEWTEPSGRMVGEYLQRIHSLAHDVITLEGDVEQLRIERDEAIRVREVQERRVVAIQAVLDQPQSDFEK